MDAPVAWPAARLRLIAVLAVILVGLGAAWYAIEVFHLVRVTVFQPFRMATLVRGIALVFVAGRLVALWRRGDWLGRLRAILIAVAITGDWLLVVVCLAELAVSAAEAIRARLPWCARLAVRRSPGSPGDARSRTEFSGAPRHRVWTYTAPGGAGVWSGGGVVGVREEYRWLAAPSSALRAPSPRRGRGEDRPGYSQNQGDREKSSPSPQRGEGWGEGPTLFLHQIGPKGMLAAALAVAWVIPLASLLAAAVPLDHAAARHPLVRGLISRCRFAAVPADDIERLGLWCRDHTPATARFIGPPGPKTFRLWSRRSLAFNRRRARIMRPGWPTGSRGFRTTWISTDRPPSSCVPTWATGTASKPATRPKATPIGRPWPCAKGRRTSSPRHPASTPKTRPLARQPGLSICCMSRGVTPSTGSIPSCSSSASDSAADA